VWTTAYRVLEEKREGEELRVRIEAEIALPRLTKRLGLPPPPRARGFTVSAVESGPGCTLGKRAEILQPLEARGVVKESGGQRLALSLECKTLGPVQLTHLLAARVVVRAQTDGGALEMRAHGFAENAEQALRAAAEEAVAKLADELAASVRADVQIVIRDPWPASKVRRLQAAIREGVLGVQSVKLGALRTGSATGGSSKTGSEVAAVLDITGSIDADTLRQRLVKLDFPDFELASLEIDSPRVLVLEIR
jgi:hypothetical protein